MRFLYNLFFTIFALFYLPCLLLKGKLHGDFLQKFGVLPDDVKRFNKPVWIHAVSVGEAVLAAKLAAAIKKRFPDVPVIVSTTTQTGNDMIRKSGKSNVDAVFYYPLDLSFIVSRVVKSIGPRLYVMIETELWPNLIEELHSNGVPIALINGRISDNSFGNYKKIKFITRRIFRNINCLNVQSKKDAERVKELGAPGDRVHITGNMKFDEVKKTDELPGFDKEYLGFKPSDEIIVAGSTHFPEEQKVIDIYKKLSEGKDNLKLILAPRHVERADAIRVYIEKSNLDYIRLSDLLNGTGNLSRGSHDIILVDTIGHLKDLYGIATVVFVGGSLVKRGGQNPIEAAKWGKAVIFGPHMFNFREVAEIFLENKAAIQVKDTVQLDSVLRDLLGNDTRKNQMAGNASKVIEQNKGSINKTVSSISEYIEAKVQA